jgi:hypothetical protein
MMRAALLFGLVAVAAPAGAVEAGKPSIAAIQAAYENARAAAKSQHDDALRIREAECLEASQGAFTCQVGFTDETSRDGRLYFDVIGLDRGKNGYTLVSGLCQR